MNDRFKINKIAISITNLEDTVNRVIAKAKDNSSAYICVTNARTAYLANKDAGYCSIQNNSFLTLPDGIPLVWVARNLGFRDVGRVAGPDLMHAIFRVSAEHNFTHYFFGSTSDTIDKIPVKIREKYPDLKILGAVSPPFQPVESFDLEALARELNQLKPTFFWCGLGAPKQEELNALLVPRLNNTICVGVGFAFEYLSESFKRPPKWIRVCGLEGVYNLKDPKRRKRFIPSFLWILLKIFQSGFQKSRVLSHKA